MLINDNSIIIDKIEEIIDWYLYLEKTSQKLNNLIEIIFNHNPLLIYVKNDYCRNKKFWPIEKIKRIKFAIAIISDQNEKFYIRLEKINKTYQNWLFYTRENISYDLFGNPIIDPQYFERFLHKIRSHRERDANYLLAEFDKINEQITNFYANIIFNV